MNRIVFSAFVVTLLALTFYSANGTYVLKHPCGEYRRFFSCCPLPQVVDVLTVDPAVCELALERANGSGNALTSVKKIAEQSGAIAAVNASFFKDDWFFLGAPAHALKVGDRWLGGQTMVRDGQPLARAVLGWRDGGKEAIIGRARTSSVVRIWTGSIAHDYPVAHINQQRGRDNAVLYTSAFFTRTPVSAAGTEIAISGGMVVGIYSGGNNLLPPGSGAAIYSIGPNAKNRQQALGIQVGSKAEIAHHVIATDIDSNTERPDDTRFDHMDVLLGGTPVLVDNGMIAPNFAVDKTIERFRDVWYPRTAVGLHRDGYWIIATVRGLGMSLIQLAEFMQSMHCKSAINLDGGTSTEFYLDPKVFRSQGISEKDLEGYLRPRNVPDALVVRRR